VKRQPRQFERLKKSPAVSVNQSSELAIGSQRGLSKWKILGAIGVSLIIGARDTSDIKEVLKPQSRKPAPKLTSYSKPEIIAPVITSSSLPPDRYSIDHPVPNNNELPLDFGPWSLSASEDFPIIFRNEVAHLFAKAYPEIVRLIGEPSKWASGSWTMELGSGGGAESSKTKTLTLSHETSDALKIHEFAHMFQSENFPEINWIREGMVVAISNIVAERIGIMRWDYNFDKNVYGENIKSNMGLDVKIPYDSNGALLSIRYGEAAKFWESLEKRVPGSIKKFTENVRSAYKDVKDEVGKIRVDLELSELTSKEILQRFMGELPPEYNDFKSLFDPHRPMEPQNLVYGIFQAPLNKDRQVREEIHVYSVQRQSNTVEYPGVRKNGKCLLKNLDNGLALDVSFITDRFGKAVLNVKDIEKRIGHSKIYDVIITIPGAKSEHFRFSRVSQY